MTHHNNIYKEEELYQQMLAELQPGADAYDQMMNQGTNPAASARRSPALWPWAAAACIASVACIALHLMPEPLPQPTEQKPIAEATAKPAHTPKQTTPLPPTEQPKQEAAQAERPASKQSAMEHLSEAIEHAISEPTAAPEVVVTKAEVVAEAPEEPTESIPVQTEDRPVRIDPNDPTLLAEIIISEEAPQPINEETVTQPVTTMLPEICVF